MSELSAKMFFEHDYVEHDCGEAVVYAEKTVRRRLRDIATASMSPREVADLIYSAVRRQLAEPIRITAQVLNDMSGHL